MKIKLSKPHYKIKKELLEKDLTAIRKRIFWRAIRRRVPFFMDEYRYANQAVKKRWGIDFFFFEGGHQQVMPVWLDKTADEASARLWMKKLREETDFGKNLIKEMLDIIKLEKNLAKSIPQRVLTSKETVKFLTQHLEYWIKFFEIAFLWFSLEYIQQETDKEIKTLWKGSKKELNKFLESIYRPINFPPSSVEQRDLLRLVPLNGPRLETALRKHQVKYKHLSLHNIDDECFDLEYYRNRIKALQESKEEYYKTKKAIETADRESKKARELLKKAKLPKDIKTRINFVQWFMYLRTASIDNMMLVSGAYKSVFSSVSQILNITPEEALHLTVEELVTSIKKRKLAIPRKLMEERVNQGYSYVMAPHGAYLVTGKEVDELIALVMPDNKIEKTSELNGQVAFKGKVIGIARVILDRRNAYELQEGEILVTTMTSPDYVPAMKKSAGIITNEGGILCHAAIMSRELRKPCIIGTKVATDLIKTGQKITLDANNGVVCLN